MNDQNSKQNADCLILKFTLLALRMRAEEKTVTFGKHKTTPVKQQADNPSSIHHFDKSYFDFMYEVEREQMRK